MYHFSHFNVFSSMVLSTFTLLQNRHHRPSLKPAHHPQLKLYPLNTNTLFPLPPAPVTTVLLSVST